MFKTPEDLVHGVVAVDGQRFKIDLKPEMLYIDAAAWFARERERHLALAEDAMRDGDEDFATEMREVADQIATLIARESCVRLPGMWPQIYNRSLIQPWTVADTPQAMRSYVRNVIEFGAASESDQSDFLMICDNGRHEFLVVDRLRAQAKFARPFTVEIVAPEEIQRRLTELR